MERCPYSYRGILKATRPALVLLLGIMLLVGLACGNNGEPEQTAVYCKKGTTHYRVAPS
jgi:hypothetical protein